MDNPTDKTAKTIIAEDIEITGTIKSASNIQFDGKLNGDLNCAGSAMLGKNAVVKGNINAEAVSISGSITGNIVVKDRIEMKSTARVQGDISAKRLTVEDGVTFVGKSEVNSSGGASTGGFPSASTSSSGGLASTPQSGSASSAGVKK